MFRILCRSSAACARTLIRPHAYQKNLVVATRFSSTPSATDESNDTNNEEYYQLIQNAQRDRVSGRKRVSESIDSKRRRLLCQSSKRGTLETTLLLGEFARLNVPQMDAAQLEGFDRLLNETECEWDIYLWAVGTSQPPQEFAEAVRLLRTYQPLVDYAKAKATVIANAKASS